MRLSPGAQSRAPVCGSAVRTDEGADENPHDADALRQSERLGSMVRAKLYCYDI